MNIETLKTEVWKKVKGNEVVTKANHHYEDIRYAILQQTGYSISRDTIRNFIEDRNQPSGRTLDIYATFVLGGDKNNIYTFQDFIKWCASHEESSQLPKASSTFDVHPIIIVVFVIMLLLILILSWRVYHPTSFVAEEKHDYYFLDSFLIEDVNTLHKNGWQILDPDQPFLDTLSVIRHEEDYLHLFTLEGDYWDTWGGWSHMLKIKNLFVHEITCKCCMITTKIDSFFPTQVDQQAGLILFDDLDRENFIRVTYKFVRNEKNKTGVAHPRIHVIQMQNKKMTEIGVFHLKAINLNSNSHFESFAMRIDVQNQKLRVTYNKNDEQFRALTSFDVFQEINYVGVAAFQGHYNHADTIPVRFDFIEVAGCDTDY